jgi:uncharacterized protein YdhG (YjbR/CyaY superfamily)
MKRERRPIATVDEYFGQIRGEGQRLALEHLRETIRAAAPNAEERLNFNLPSFFQNGRLVSIGATRTHCALYLVSKATVEDFQRELADYDTSNGTIRFQPDRPLPDALVRRLVEARVAENAD